MATAVVPARRGWQETVAIVLLLVGGFLWGAGWLVGVVLLWLSDVWSLREKLLGTFVVPFGLALPSLVAVLTLAEGGASGWRIGGGAVLVAALFVAPTVTAVHLARTSRPR